MKAKVVNQIATKHIGRLEERCGKSVHCFLFNKPQGVQHTLMMFVSHDRESVQAGIATADDWYVRYNLNHVSYLKLRRDLGYLLRKCA